MGKARFDIAKERYPSVFMDEQGWKTFLDTPAGFSAMGRLIGDIYDEVLALEEREAGKRSLGRRPSREEVPLDEVFAKVFGVPFSTDPFPLALQQLIVGRSQRQFAQRIPIDQSTLSRFLSGQAEPNFTMMERIATAAKVSPGYFVEYRAMYMARLVEDTLRRRPNLGIKAMRNMSSSKKNHEKGNA